MPLGGLLLFRECRDGWNVREHLASGWLIYPCAVGVEQTRGVMVTGCGSWVVRLGRVRVVGEGKGPVCRPVGWSFVVGGVIWWAHTLFGCARTQVRVFISTMGCVVWDFARENSVGSLLWFGVDGRVNSVGFGWFRVGVVYPRGVSTSGMFWACVFQRGVQECELVELVSGEGVVWYFVAWGCRGGVFYHFFHFVKTDHLSITPCHSPSVHDRAVETFVSRGEKGSGRLPYPSDTTISVGWKDGLAWLSPRAESERAHDLQGR